MNGSDTVVAGPLRQALSRIVSPAAKRLRTVMSSGLTPEKLARTFCLGGAIGVMPLLWGTSLLCMALAHVLRINQVALQTVNYLLYPLQLVLLVPFFKLGMRLFPWGPPVPPHLLDTVLQSPGRSWPLLGWLTVKSLAAWLVTAVPAALLIYGALRVTLSGNRTETSEV